VGNTFSWRIEAEFGAVCWRRGGGGWWCCGKGGRREWKMEEEKQTRESRSGRRLKGEVGLDALVIVDQSSDL